METNNLTDGTNEMTVEEKHEHEKIKRAVSESLLEALHIADTKQQTKDDQRGVGWILDVLGKLVPVVIIALLSWMCVTIITIQKDIVEMRGQISGVDGHITEHTNIQKQQQEVSGLIHHTAIVAPCNSCHTPTGINSKGISVLKNKKQ